MMGKLLIFLLSLALIASLDVDLRVFTAMGIAIFTLLLAMELMPPGRPSRFMRLHIEDGKVDLLIGTTPDLRFIPPGRRRRVIEGHYRAIDQEQQ